MKRAPWSHAQTRIWAVHIAILPRSWDWPASRRHPFSRNKVYGYFTDITRRSSGAAFRTEVESASQTASVAEQRDATADQQRTAEGRDRQGGREAAASGKH